MICIIMLIMPASGHGGPSAEVHEGLGAPQLICVCVCIYIYI